MGKSAIMKKIRDAKKGRGYGGRGYTLKVVSREHPDDGFIGFDLRSFPEGTDMWHRHPVSDVIGQLRGDELLDVLVYKYLDARTRDDVELWDDFEIDLKRGA